VSGMWRGGRVEGYNVNVIMIYITKLYNINVIYNVNCYITLYNVIYITVIYNYVCHIYTYNVTYDFL